jgi:hypothetical protein
MLTTQQDDGLSPTKKLLYVKGTWNPVEKLACIPENKDYSAPNKASLLLLIITGILSGPLSKTK